MRGDHARRTAPRPVPPHRGLRAASPRGLGSALLDAIDERARRVGATAVRLDSWSFNTEAHRFFATQGFAVSQHVFEHRVDPLFSTAALDLTPKD